MTLIFCTDDRGGLAFNGRRQSRDRIQRERMLAHAGKGDLYMTESSAALFESLPACVRVCARPADEAGEDDACFVECGEVRGPLRRAHTAVIFRWGRIYPSDLRVEEGDLSDFCCVRSTEFAGSSHESMLEEIWVRKDCTRHLR